MIVDMQEAKENLSNLISRFEQGEKIVIAKNGKPVLEFAPVKAEKPGSRPLGFFNCDIDMSHFDDPLEEMKEYH